MTCFLHCQYSYLYNLRVFYTHYRFFSYTRRMKVFPCATAGQVGANIMTQTADTYTQTQSQTLATRMGLSFDNSTPARRGAKTIFRGLETPAPVTGWRPVSGKSGRVRAVPGDGLQRGEKMTLDWPQVRQRDTNTVRRDGLQMLAALIGAVAVVQFR